MPPPLLLAFATLALSGCGSSRDAETLHGRLVAEGSSSLYPYINAAAAVFHQDHPGVAFDIQKHGSGVGIKQLAEQGGLDFANASRPVKLAELDSAESHGRRIHATVVAADSVVVVVNPANPVANISVGDLKAIFFTGEKRDWSSIPGSGRTGPIHVVGIDPKISGTGETFTEMVGGHTKPPYIAGATTVADNPYVPNTVMSDPDAIAFCSNAVLAGTTLRVLEVEGVRPSEQAVLDSSYPLNRRLYFLTDGPPRGLTADFLLFLLSEPGQRLARERGLTPVTLEVSL